MDSKKTQFQGDSYCGLHCGACEILNLYRRQLDQGLVPSWEDMPAPMNGVISPAELACTGCKTELLFSGCLKCDIRMCGHQKGVEACVVCPDYPCQLVEQRKVFLADRMKDLLPHTAVMFSQGEPIREIGFEAWRVEQEKQWCCPECGEPFTWYQEKCRQCGRDLGGIKEYEHISS
jgi:hypothetical protein